MNTSLYATWMLWATYQALLVSVDPRLARPLADITVLSALIERHLYLCPAHRH